MPEKFVNKKRFKNGTSDFEEQIKKLSKTDFNGHTEFIKLSYEEKLLWLSQAVQFSVKYSGKIKNT